MTYLTGEVTVIHDSAAVDFENFVYSAVYCNAVACSDTVNGTLVSMALGDSIEVLVDKNTTVVPGSGTLLFLGNPMPVQTEYPTGLLSGGTTPTGWVDEVWQFVNIKNGNPTDG
jgi:hypothetical protein